MGPDAVILVFWLLSFKPAFSLSSFTFIKRRFSSFLLSALRVVKVKVIKLCLTLVTPCTVACQALLFMEFSRQEHWSGLPFPFPGDLPNPRIEPISSALAGGFFTAKPPRKFKLNFTVSIQITLVAVVGGWIEEEQVWRPEETSQAYCNSQGEAERQLELAWQHERQMWVARRDTELLVSTDLVISWEQEVRQRVYS